MQDSGNKERSRQITEAIERVLDEGRIAALVTLVEAPTGVGAKLLIPAAGQKTGSLGDSELDRAVIDFAEVFLESRDDAHVFQVKEFAPQLSQWSEARVLFERIQPEPRIVICGAGHVGAALAKLASFIGYRATLIDDRTEFVTRGRFPDERIELIAAETWAKAVREAIGNGRGVSVAVVTRAACPMLRPVPTSKGLRPAKAIPRSAIAARTSISMDPLDRAMRVRLVFIECECSQPG